MYKDVFILLLISLISSKPMPALTQTATGCINKSKPRYFLPYPSGKSYYLLQGNCGRHSHFEHQQFAYDFRMPIGSFVTAMRSGRVVNVKEQFHDNTNNSDSLNFLIILHEDSTAARYLHLTFQGVLVEKGDFVQAGDTIAISGNTGISTEPHLHVDITGYCTKAPCQTLPFSFINSNDPVPVQGKTYLAYKIRRWQLR